MIAGDNHMFALDNQKNLYCWGDNFIGQLGLGHNKIMNEISVNKILPKMQDIQSKGIFRFNWRRQAVALAFSEG